MTLDSITKYTEESIKCTRELQKFLTQKSQLEAESAQKMVKLCQNTLQQFSGDMPAAPRRKGKNDGPKYGEKFHVLETTLWQTFMELVQKVYDSATTLRTLSTEVDNEISNPFNNYIKEMESIRKGIVEEGQRQTAVLQESFLSLKKAKQAHDDALGAYNETKEAHLRNSRLPNIKEKEMDKWNQKVATAKEKVDQTAGAYQACQDICDSAQFKYWKQRAPNIIKQLYTKEQERCLIVHDALRNWVSMEKQYADFLDKGHEHMYEKVEQVDLAGDLHNLLHHHLEVDEEKNATTAAAGGLPNIPVRSLLNPLKSGRLFRNESDSWKSQYFIIMGDRGDPAHPDYNAGSGRMYIYESEDSLKPRMLIDLSTAWVHAVDESCFPGKTNIFVLTTKLMTTEKNALVTKEKVVYMSAISAEERQEWITTLNRYTMCCLDGVVKALADPVTLNLDETENVVADFPKANPREFYFRRVQSLKLSIMEARDLNFLDVALAQSAGVADSPADSSFFPLTNRGASFNPYCSIAVNGIRLAKTFQKTVTSPFWGEEFFFDDLSECSTEFRITVHSAGKKKDVDLGYIDINIDMFLENFQPNKVKKKWESWLPLMRMNDDDSNVDNTGSPSIRIIAVYSEESILPLYEYPSFLNCLFEADFEILKTLAKSAARCTSFARDDFSRSLINILVATKTDIAAIRALLQVDVESTEDPNIIFRGNSLATKAIDQYMKYLGGEFLKNTLSGAIRLVYDKSSKQELCEVDPTRMEAPTEELLKKNQKRLMAWVTMFWDAIQNSVEKTPRQLREALQSIREMVIKEFYFKDGVNQETVNQVQYSAVSGFIFLRFFCPAILNPKLFGLWPEVSENTVATRTLTLIAKVLQNLANLTDFKSKEPHMEFANQWILWNMDAMKTCIMQFSTCDYSDATANEIRYAFFLEHLGKVDLSREFNLLYIQIVHNLPELKIQYDELAGNVEIDDLDVTKASTLKGIDYNLLAALFRQLDIMKTMYSKYEKASMDNQQALRSNQNLSRQLKVLTLNAASPQSHNLKTLTLTGSKHKRATSSGAKSVISSPTLVQSSNPDIIFEANRRATAEPNVVNQIEEPENPAQNGARGSSHSRRASAKPPPPPVPVPVPSFKRRPSIIAGEEGSSSVATDFVQEAQRAFEHALQLSESINVNSTAAGQVPIVGAVVPAPKTSSVNTVPPSPLVPVTNFVEQPTTTPQTPVLTVLHSVPVNATSVGDLSPQASPPATEKFSKKFGANTIRLYKKLFKSRADGLEGDSDEPSKLHKGNVTQSTPIPGPDDGRT